MRLRNFLCRTGPLCLLVFLFSSLPARAGIEGEEELASEATIRRDTFGVPHILAKTEEAAAFAYGYAAAEDHVLEIARLYLKARDEEAAYFGEDFLASDRLGKQFRNYEVSAGGYAKSPPWFQRILDAYAAGYNRYVRAHREDLPEWVKPVTGIDVLAHCRRVIVMEFCANFRQIQALDKKEEKRAARLDESYYGSNMWAISKDRSATGNALLLGNPHLRWWGSHIWHEVHVTVPGVINHLGAALIGFPGAGLGFNEYMGWSHTVNPHDCDDIYELTLAPGDPESYLYDGRPVPLTKREIILNVKTENGVEERREVIYDSHYGPVVKRNGDKAYAFKSANAEVYRFVEQWYLMTKSKTFAEWRRVLDMQALPMFNIAYADVEGNCFYVFNGRFPQRPEGYDWSKVVPGNTSASEWTHVLPQSRLPQLLNPKSGYVQNCNSSPWYTNLRSIIDRNDFPEYISPLNNSLRTQHSLELLENDDSLTLDDLLKYKYSMNLVLADRVKDGLVAIARGRTVDGYSLDEAVSALETWDNSVARDSRGSILFVQFWRAYREVADPVFAVPWTERHPASTPHGIGDPDTALNVLAKTAQGMKESFGSLTIPWGMAFRLKRGDLDVPIGGFTGDFGAFRVIGYAPTDDGRFVAMGGDSYVFAVEFSSPPKAYSIMAYSQSGDPASPHHTDQSVLFAKEQWKRAWFTEKDVKKHTKKTYHP